MRIGSQVPGTLRRAADALGLARDPWLLVPFVAGATSIASLLGYFYGFFSMSNGVRWVLLPGVALAAAFVPLARRAGRRDLADRALAGIFAGGFATLACDVCRIPLVHAGLPIFKAISYFGTLIVGSAAVTPVAERAGWAYHYSNGIGFALMYAALFARARLWTAVVWGTALEGAMLLTPYAEVFGYTRGQQFLAITLGAHFVYGAGLWAGFRLWDGHWLRPTRRGLAAGFLLPPVDVWPMLRRRVPRNTFLLAATARGAAASVGALGALALLACTVLPGLEPDGRPALDDADLRVEPAPVDDASNGYLRLEEAAAALVLSEEEQKRLFEIRVDEAWDEELVRTLVTRNEPALGRLRAALEALRFQRPLPERPLEDPFPEIPRWICLTKLSALRGVLRARAGDAGAFADALAAMRVGSLVQSDPNAMLVQAMLGTGLKGIGARGLAAALPDLRPSPEASRARAREVAALRTDPAAWSAMWASEYRSYLRTSSSMEREAGAPDPADSVPPRQVRAIQTWAGRPCAEWLAPDGPEGGLRSRVLLLGQVDFDKFELRRCESDSRNAAVQALVGLRAYQVEHAALPRSLEELVPRYLDELPLDAFDGAPLRYDPERLRLYSLGSDLRAESVLGPTDDPILLEPIFPIPFGVDRARATGIADAIVGEGRGRPPDLEIVMAERFSSPPAGPLEAEIAAKLRGRSYWLISYAPRPMQLGGSVAVFVDASSGEVVHVYRGR